MERLEEETQELAIKPLLTLVVPCYNVERFLPEFLSSIDGQGVDPSEIELVFIVDGSPDGTEAILRRWAATAVWTVTIRVTTNQGVSAARNLGLDLASGVWVTFPDPDDLLGRGYLESVLQTLRRQPTESLITTRLVRVEEGSKQLLGHVLDYRYAQGSRVTDLEAEPTLLQLAVHTAVFRRDLLVASGVRFDPRLKVFEDGKFVAEYLLAAPNQRVSILAEANYIYQVRSDNSGALASSNSDLVNRYLTTIQFGHLELLQRKAAKGSVPQWLQNMVLYDLYWLFSASMRMKDPIHGAPRALLVELNAVVRNLLRNFTYEALWAFNIVSVPPEIRGAWLVGNAGGISHRWARSYRRDTTTGDIEVRYLTAEPENSDTALAGETRIAPSFSKARSVEFFREVWLYEMVLWYPPHGQLRLVSPSSQVEGFACQGRVMTDAEFQVTFKWDKPSPPPSVRVHLVSGRKLELRDSSTTKLLERIRSTAKRLINRAAVLPPLSLPFRNSWVLLDRDTQANDNAEAFARYLHESQPTVRLVFVIRRSSPDYKRLLRSGLPVVPFGSVRHYLAVRNASHLVSSHIDEYVVRPFKNMQVNKTWNFVFLQHGVTHNDLSRWFNSKDVQLVAAATQPEVSAFVADGTPYIFSSKEVRLTGFPRHDRLVQALSAPGRSAETGSILVMPTWRSYLLTETSGKGNDRSAGAHLSTSTYAQQWRDFLNNPHLKELADVHGLELVLLPHPNLEPYLQILEVPSTVSVRSYRTANVAELMVQARITVTDYSSQAFEGAFCGAPSVYFQFDREEFYGGGHIGSPGYFDVIRDGFGPVIKTSPDAVRAVAELLDADSDVARQYQQRIAQLYPHRDGRASERVYTEISKLRDRYVDAT